MTEIMNGEITGRKFNALYGHIQFCKLTNSTECHNGYIFKTGLNIDFRNFVPYNDYGGGIYFTSFNDIHLWLNYNGERMSYLRYVTIPDDARIFYETDKVKTNKIILSEKIYIWTNFYICQHILKYSFNNYIVDHPLQYINIYNQTDMKTLYKIAFQKNGCAIMYANLHYLDEDLILTAINQNAKALQYIPYYMQTYNICFKAVSQNGWCLEFVNAELQDVVICEYAIKDCPHTVQFVSTIHNKRHTLDYLYYLAITLDPNMLCYVSEEFQTFDLCLNSINKDYDTINLIKNNFLKTQIAFHFNIKKILSVFKTQII